MNREEKEKIKKDLLQTTEKYLEYCNEKRTPFVCELKNKKGGVDKIKKHVLHMCLNYADMPVGRAIQDLEKTLNPYYDDFNT